MPWRHMGEWRHSSTILDLGTGSRWVISFTLVPLYNCSKQVSINKSDTCSIFFFWWIFNSCLYSVDYIFPLESGVGIGDQNHNAVVEASAYISPKFSATWPIFAKLNIGIIPLKISPVCTLQFSALSNNDISYTRIRYLWISGDRRERIKRNSFSLAIREVGNRVGSIFI
jgi:hypothetical protein